MLRQKQNIHLTKLEELGARLSQESSDRKLHKQRLHQSLLPNTKKKSLI